jgi:hypothetical protein
VRCGKDPSDGSRLRYENDGRRFSRSGVKAPTDRALLDESPFDFLPPFPPA